MDGFLRAIGPELGIDSCYLQGAFQSTFLSLSNRASGKTGGWLLAHALRARLFFSGRGRTACRVLSARQIGGFRFV